MPNLQGAGAFGAGLGSAGFDPVLDPSPSNASTAPAALLFDPTTRDFRMNADGRFAAVDPVDQEVVFALWPRKGTIGSCPSAGSEIRSLKRQGGKDFLATIDDIVRRALQRLTDRGAIKILAIDVSTPQRGRTYILVTYVNLTLATTQKSTTLPVAL